MAISGTMRIREWIWALKPPTLALTLVGAGVLADRFGWPDHLLAAPVPGTILIVSGLALLLWAHEAFRRSGTPVPHRRTPTELVEGGPYRFTRNPMYFGIALTGFGVAVTFGGLAATAAASAWCWIVNVVHIPAEEARMASIFGGRWRAYAHRVRRWA